MSAGVGASTRVWCWRAPSRGRGGGGGA